MNEIPKKNYYILLGLILGTIFLTLSLSYIYINKDKTISNFYMYSNKITSEEFDEYIIENPNLIVYISDKYNLSYEDFEKKFEKKINELNLKDNLVYIDKSSLSKKFLSDLEKKYNLNINRKKLPIIIVISDKRIIKTIFVEPTSDVETIIDYEVFE